VIDPDLAGLTALVTGGASGIGRALAAGLEAEGAAVAVVDRSESDIGSVRIQETLGDERTSERVVASVEKELGRIDLLVNCAAVARHEPLTRLSTDAWEATLSSNLGSCVWTCRAVGRRMIAARRGSILIVGSTSIYTPASGESLYRASKAGLKAFAEVVALELAPHGIRVNLLTPGAVATPLTAGMSDRQRARLIAEIPLGREAVPDELVATALVLLSDRLSPYTTGAEFVVDGGISLRPLDLLDAEGAARPGG
jgi:NAD(P)-dependent dehydrogenase (short-subunit alcohol dehydrogenase family)